MNILDIDNFPFKIPNNHYIKIPKECSFWFESMVTVNNIPFFQYPEDMFLLRKLNGTLLLLNDYQLGYYIHNPKEITWNS